MGDALEMKIRRSPRAWVVAKRDKRELSFWWSRRNKRKLLARMFTFFELNNGWLVPVTILVKGRQIFIAHNLVCDSTKYRWDGEPRTRTTLTKLHKDVQKLYDEAGTIATIKEQNWSPMEKFNHNCRRRLLGFLQGKLYRMVDDEEYVPEMNLKRRREIPRGEIDNVALCIVGFLAINEIFRNPEDDFYKARPWVQLI